MSPSQIKHHQQLSAIQAQLLTNNLQNQKTFPQMIEQQRQQLEMGKPQFISKHQYSQQGVFYYQNPQQKPLINDHNQFQNTVGTILTQNGQSHMHDHFLNIQKQRSSNSQGSNVDKKFQLKYDMSVRASQHQLNQDQKVLNTIGNQMLSSPMKE